MVGGVGGPGVLSPQYQTDRRLVNNFLFPKNDSISLRASNNLEMVESTSKLPFENQNLLARLKSPSNFESNHLPSPSKRHILTPRTNSVIP